MLAADRHADRHADRYADILVVDLLGGIGDLLMILPAIHGLAWRNPGARLRVVTYEPGADLVRGDPAVAQVYGVRDHQPGAVRRAVTGALATGRPDLAVTTTRYDGIPELLTASGARCVTDLWRRPPADELVTGRYLRILYDEGLLDTDDLDRPPRVRLTTAERVAGNRVLTGCLASFSPATSPVLLVTDAGMAVKLWPDRHWRRLVHLLVAAGHPVLGVTPNPYVPALPSGTLRQLAACFAAVAGLGGIVVGADTGPLRLAAAAGAGTVGLFGPTLAARYGLGESTGTEIQGRPDCAHRRPTSITEQVCWWGGDCPLDNREPACMADIGPERVVAHIRGFKRSVSSIAGRPRR